MTYRETCDYLFNQLPMFEQQGASGYKEGLENSHALDEHFGHPHHQYRTIHIAGTNGKGSCAHTLSAILQNCGYKVGLYTSPHLVDFSERIRVNGKPIPEEYVVDFVEKEKGFFHSLHPSFFEIVTAMAFKYFAEQEVDIAVIEVGMGGRLDCTNIITPILSVITNIGLDHMQYLGNTVEQIAAEKAGIIKKEVPVVIGETTPNTRMIFEGMAEENKAPIYFAEDFNQVLSATLKNQKMVYETKDFGIITGDLTGNYQEKNTNTILCAVKVLEDQGYMFPCDCKPNIACENREVRYGFREVCKLTGLQGRWQKFDTTPVTICDTGHNVPGWEYLSKQLAEVEYKHLHIVFGMVEDKDFEGVMKLLPKDATYYFTKSSNKRSLTGELLKVFAQNFGLKGESYPDVMTAYNKARKAALNNDLVFIGGSSYVVADFLKNRI